MRSIAIYLLAMGHCIFAISHAAEPEVEMTVMALGDPSGSELQAGSVGCAVVHFKNHLERVVRFPTAPRGLGKGRIKNWNGASYISPKQGKGYGWGYRAAYDIPKVQIEFVGKDGAIVHVDSSIQLQRIGLMHEGGWGASPVVFSTPASPGVYSVRFSFDNTNMLQDSGHNNVEAVPAGTPIPQVVVASMTIELTGISVVEEQAEQAAAGDPAKPANLK